MSLFLDDADERRLLGGSLSIRSVASLPAVVGSFLLDAIAVLLFRDDEDYNYETYRSSCCTS